MIARSLKVHKIIFNIKPVIILIILLAGCQPGGCSSERDIIIAENDTTPPSLTLTAEQPGGQSATVSAGGSGQNMTLMSKTGPLNLLATAQDSESGVQAVEIWVNKKTTSCDANEVCSITGPGLSSKPWYYIYSPEMKPGETTTDSGRADQSLDLAMQIPQGSLPEGESLTVELIVYAVAVNHLGGRTQTPNLAVVWREP